MLRFISRAARAAAIALFGMLVLAGPAAAASVAVAPLTVHSVTALSAPPGQVLTLAPAASQDVVVVAGPELLFTIDPATVVQLVLTLVLPGLVGLVTTRVTSSAVKSWLLAGFTLATSVLTELLRSFTDNISFDLGRGLLAAIPAFAISVMTYYGIWKPTGAAVALQDLGPAGKAAALAAAAPPAPTIGRVVLFTPAADTSTPLPAIVTKVWSGELVNLQIFTGGSNVVSYATSVKRADEPGIPITWAWPART